MSTPTSRSSASGASSAGFREVIRHSQTTNRRRSNLTLRLEAASDFADLFEVKDALTKSGTYRARVDRA